MQKMGTIDERFNPSLPIKTIPLSSEFSIKKVSEEKTGPKRQKKKTHKNKLD